MSLTPTPNLATKPSFLGGGGYEVSEPAPDTITIRELDSGVSLQAVLEGDILFLSLPCTTVPRTAVTPEIMATMLAADNGISTSAFQLQDMGPEDEDDILSCVHFLLVDVMTARHLLSGLSA